MGGAFTVDQALALLAEGGEALNAITVTTADRARALAAQGAERAASGGQDRPLEGIALAVKDVIDLEGYPTSMGSAVDTERDEPTTAPVVAALERAGALTVAKTNCQEFSYGILGDESVFGKVVNPRGVELCTGGSSSGSTALVAAGAVPLAVGTDTAGSVRVPAACTGTIGFKPTFGLVPVEGVFPLAPSCDTIGFFALDVGLIRRAFLAARVEGGYPVEAGQVPMPPARSPSPTRAAASTGGTGAAGADAAAEAGAGPGVPSARVLRAGDDSAAGRHLDSVIDASLQLYEVLRKYEAYAIHRGFLAAQGERYQPVVRQRALAGADVTRAEYEDARAGQEALRESALSLFDEADLIVTPAMGVAVPRWSEIGPEHRAAFTHFATPFNVLGWPAITLPTAGEAVTASGALATAGPADGVQPTVLPESIQLVAAPGEDLHLLESAERYLLTR